MSKKEDLASNARIRRQYPAFERKNHYVARGLEPAVCLGYSMPAPDVRYPETLFLVLSIGMLGKSLRL